MQQQQKETAVPPPPTPPVFSDWNSPWDQPAVAEEPVPVQSDYQKPSQHLSNLNVGYDPTMPGLVPPLDYKPLHIPPVNFGNQMTAQLTPEFDKSMHQHVNYENPVVRILTLFSFCYFFFFSQLRLMWIIAKWVLYMMCHRVI